MSGTVSWRQLWDETTALTGRPQARWLCEEASGAFGEEFLDQLDASATERSVAHLDAMLARVRRGEPLQYVLGHWSFRRLDLLIDRRVLIPRPETELLVEHALAVLRPAVAVGDGPVVVADLGTGSGAIGLSLVAELPRGSVDVWLTDTSADALDVARANLAGLGLAGSHVRVSHGSWFEALPSEMRGSLAAVVSNPPYIAVDDPELERAVRDWEPEVALIADDDGLAHLRAIASGAAEWLRPGGWVLLEIGASQGDIVRKVLREAGLVDVEVRTDLAGRDRFAVARRATKN